MDILNQVSRHIQALNTGEQWILTAQDLLVSRSDFHALSLYLSRESTKGQYSISPTQSLMTADLSLTVVKH